MKPPARSLPSAEAPQPDPSLPRRHLRSVREGERFLLEKGITETIARFCLSHAQWSTLSCSLEELIVALADALWKGVRREAIERRVIDEVAGRLGVDMWEVFVELDSAFEEIADGGGERLGRSG